MDNFTFTEEKLNQIIFDARKDASVYTLEVVLNIITDFQEKVKKEYGHSLKHDIIKSHKGSRLRGQQISADEIFKEISVFKASVEHLRFK